MEIGDLFLIGDVGIGSNEDELVGVFVHGHPSLEEGHKGTLGLIHLVGLLKLQLEFVQEALPLTKVFGGIHPNCLVEVVLCPHARHSVSHV